MDRASLESLLSRGLSLAEIGRRLGRHESTVAYWMQRYGLEAVHSDRHGARGPLAREQLEQLVARGSSIAEIAREVGRSKSTVRHWLTRYGLKTRNGPGRRASAEAFSAKQAGLVCATMTCPHHGPSEFVLDERGCYRCRRCRAEAVTRRRRRMKAILVSEAGGACCICGYRTSMRALHFHHVDPAEKRLALNAKGVALSLAALRAEAQKCVLLCSNCHAEVEDGLASVPVDALERTSSGVARDGPG